MELKKYTVAHFAAEEAYMQSIGYPELDTHKNAHRDFVDRVAREKQHAIETSAFSLDLIHYLREWLVNHIRVTDKRYADYTSTKQQAPSEIRFWRVFLSGFPDSSLYLRLRLMQAGTGLFLS